MPRDLLEVQIGDHDEHAVRQESSAKPPQVTMGFDDFVALLSDWHELRMQRR